MSTESATVKDEVTLPTLNSNTFQGTLSHTEWEKGNHSLTAPADRDHNEKRKLKQNLALTEEETLEALNTLVVRDYVGNFPKFDKLYCDKPITNQTYCLFSFTPAKGAVPDKDGIYGMAKFRGAFSSLQEVEQREEELIRDDCFHPVNVCFVGKPFPVAFDIAKFVKETKEIDIRKKTTEVYSDDIRQKKANELKEIQFMKDREKDLLSDVSTPEDPYDRYTTLKVKKAQLTWTYIETEKKMEEMKRIIVKTRGELKDMDNENSDFAKKYYEKYMEARKQAHLPDNDDSFMKYLCDDFDLGF